MLKYIWSQESRVYHDRDETEERCNTDQLKDRQESDTPPITLVGGIFYRRLCAFCRARKERRNA